MSRNVKMHFIWLVVSKYESIVYVCTVCIYVYCNTVGLCIIKHTRYYSILLAQGQLLVINIYSVHVE